MGSEAFGSPISAQLITPPLITILGLAAKELIGQSTMSASLPGSSEPMWSAVPEATAGLMVSLAR